MSTNNGNPKHPWRRGGGSRRDSNGHSRRAPGGGRGQSTQSNGSKNGDKMYMSVPFTKDMARTHHTFKDTKEAFICAVSLKLGEYAQDVRKAVQDKLPHVFMISARGQAKPSTLQRPVQPVPAGDVLTTAEQTTEQQYQVDLAVYTAEEEGARFQQTTPHSLTMRRGKQLMRETLQGHTIYSCCSFVAM